MYSIEIKFSPYEYNNFNLFQHIALKCGVYIKNKVNITLIALNKERLNLLISEWKKEFDKLFIYCERYKMLKLPHFRVARQQKVKELIEKYKPDFDYSNEYKQIQKELNL